MGQTARALGRISRLSLNLRQKTVPFGWGNVGLMTWTSGLRLSLAGAFLAAGAGLAMRSAWANPNLFQQVSFKERTETVRVEPTVKREERNDLPAGRTKTVSQGQPGYVHKTYQVILVGGKEAGERLMKTVRQDPKPIVIYVGVPKGSAAARPAPNAPAAPARAARTSRAGRLSASRSMPRSGRIVETAAEATLGRTNPAKLKELGLASEPRQSAIQAAYAGLRGWNLEGGMLRTMKSTAYTPDAGLSNPTFRTASGRPAMRGMIAVDPRVIPMHSLLYVEGYGWGVAADTGGAIKGSIVDVCVESNSEARQWGRRTVRVIVFPEKVVGDTPRRS